MTRKVSLVLILTGALASLTATPALAARGHEFGETIGYGVVNGANELQVCTSEHAKKEACKHGLAGAGKGEFDTPDAVAVNEATGDFYVLDEVNDRVERFSGAGQYLGEFDGSGTFEKEGKVEVEAGGGPPTGRFSKAKAVAVDSSTDSSDPSKGDVYVADGFEHKLVDKFTAAGEYIGQIQIPESPEGLEGVAVDASGGLWVAVDGLETLAGPHFGFARFDDSVVNKATGFVGDGGLRLDEGGLALDRKGDVFANINSTSFVEVVAEFSSSGGLLGVVDEARASGVGVERLSGDVFVDNVGSVGRFEQGVRFREVERFGLGVLVAGRGVGVDPMVGRGGPVYVADAGGHDLVVFPLEGPKPPTVVGASVSAVTSGSATLQAEVNPRGALTEYHFEYGECPSVSTCVGAPFEKSAPEPYGMVGGASDFEGQQLSIHPQDLQPATTYHFRVVAHNEKSPSGSDATSPEETFTTQPVEPFALPDGRAWELVSPAQKQGALIDSIFEQGVIQSAVAGTAFTYLADSPTEADPRGYTNSVQVLSRRTGAGWASEDLPVAHAKATGPSIGEGEEYLLFSPDLSLGVLQSFGAFEPLTSPEASEQTPYLRTNFSGGNVEAPCAVGCYRPLVTAGNVREGVSFGEEGQCPPRLLCGPRVVGASPDAQHIVVRSEVGLSGVTGDAGGLYEWSEGALSLVSVLPGGKPAALSSRSTLGGGQDTRGAVSLDGSRVVWSENAGGNHLYLRDLVARKTFELDEGLSGKPVFEAASADGSRVFFTDGGGDLYVYEVEKGKAVRLTVPVGVGEKTNVQGQIAGVSEDGSYVYFVAEGKLNSKAPMVAGGCQSPTSESECYLYVDREVGGVWGTPQVVAVLSGSDLPDFRSALPDLTVRVSPDGRFLAFMSDRSLTGYDNSDAVSGKPDEEVFLYDAATGHLSCASCNPTGARPTGVEYEQLEKSLVGGDKVWQSSTWLAANVPGWTPYELNAAFYQSRYLSNSGRLFFNSSDALSPQDVNGTEDVYEFEPPGIGNCSETSLSFSARSGGCVNLISAGTSRGESAFLDASESGDDVFFLTSARLVSEDFDTALDVYDAHACSTTSPCLAEPALPPPPCVSEAACKAPPTPQPEIFGPPASATFSGLGNILAGPPVSSKPRAKALTRTELLVKALGVCRREHPHSAKHRRSCEGEARSRYAHATGANHKESKR